MNFLELREVISSVPQRFSGSGNSSYSSRSSAAALFTMASWSKSNSGSIEPSGLIGTNSPRRRRVSAWLRSADEPPPIPHVQYVCTGATAVFGGRFPEPSSECAGER